MLPNKNENTVKYQLAITKTQQISNIFQKLYHVKKKNLFSNLIKIKQIEKKTDTVFGFHGVSSLLLK